MEGSGEWQPVGEGNSLLARANKELNLFTKQLPSTTPFYQLHPLYRTSFLITLLALFHTSQLSYQDRSRSNISPERTKRGLC
jgi:hypothetical protein